MDTLQEIGRKQRLLREVAQQERVDLKWHEAGGSWLEGIFARGDRRLADVLEAGWRMGARFDGWEEHLKVPLWQRALDECGVDPTPYLDEIPIGARLPWDHLDIGLEDGFLAREWEKAAKSRAAPPCGKASGSLLHHSTVEDAEEDHRKLVCYDCGVACDMDHMREERIVYLKELGAHRAPAVALRVVTEGEVGETGAVTETEARSDGHGHGEGGPMAAARVEAAPMERKHQHPKAEFEQGEGTRYRIAYTKLGRAAFISHLDTSRLLQRLLRRAGVKVNYSRGFHPKPDLTFGPALALGVAALGELVDVRLDEQPESEALAERLRAATPDGVRILKVARLGGQDAGVNRLITLAEWAALVPAEVAARLRLGEAPAPVVRMQKGERKVIDVARHLVRASLASDEEGARLRGLLEWAVGDNEVVLFCTRIQGDGGVKPAEVIESLLGATPPAGMRLARLALLGGDESAARDVFPSAPAEASGSSCLPACLGA